MFWHDLFTKAARPGENVIAIRVEDKNCQGGLTKRCFLEGKGSCLIGIW